MLYTKYSVKIYLFLYHNITNNGGHTCIIVYTNISLLCFNTNISLYKLAMKKKYKSYILKISQFLH